MSSLTDFDPFSAEVVADPYPWYERLLQEGPVQWIPSRELWMVTGYEEIASVIRDPGAYSSGLGYAALSAGRMNPDRSDASGTMGVDTAALRMLITTDPPEHTRIRRLLSRAFTPRAVAELEPRLRVLCGELVAKAVSGAAGGAGDLVSDLAVAFPVTVIAELLGIPPDRRDDFRRWSDAMSGVLSGETNLADAAVAGAELFGFMADVVGQRQAHPGDDLISRLVVGGGEGDFEALSLEELTMIGILLLVAGNETTTNLIGNTAAALAAHPGQAEALLASPELLPSAIEEVLRWDSPVQGTLRGTTRDTSLAGMDIPAGAIVLTCFAAANRDPSHFDNPARFDIGRRANDHFAFGHGIHFCLGAALARVETRVLFETLAGQGVRLESMDGAVRTAGFMLRGFTQYPVAYARDSDM
jgi:cytochrome P450